MKIIAIAGGSGSGKTTIVRELQKRVGPLSVISLDSYYLDRTGLSAEAKAEINYDEPAALDLELLADHIETLAAGKEALIPQYDFATHTRRSEAIALRVENVLIVEGLFALYPERIRNRADLKIFVDVDADRRLARRLERDVAERGRTFKEVLHQYFLCVKPMHEAYIEPSKAFATWILPWNEYNEGAIVGLSLLLLSHKRSLTS